MNVLAQVEPKRIRERIGSITFREWTVQKEQREAEEAPKEDRSLPSDQRLENFAKKKTAIGEKLRRRRACGKDDRRRCKDGPQGRGREAQSREVEPGGGGGGGVAGVVVGGEGTRPPGTGGTGGMGPARRTWARARRTSKSGASFVPGRHISRSMEEKE